MNCHQSCKVLCLKPTPSDIFTPPFKRTQNSHALTLSKSFQPLSTMSLTSASPNEAAKSAKSASHILATLPTAARNDALTAIHAALIQSKKAILSANARDLHSAKKAAEDGKLSLSLVSRLDLNKKGKWEDMLKGILDVRELEDPGESIKLLKPHLYSPLTNSSWQSHITNETRRWP